MRLSLLLFLCLAYNMATAQQIRLKSLQFGTTLAVQVDREDTTLADVRKLVKDPQSFPKNRLDTLERDFGQGLFYGSSSGVQLALLTTWAINPDKKILWDLQKEWNIGLEYSYASNSEEQWTSTGPFTGSPFATTDIYFRRHNHLIGLYTDFVFKKGFSRNRVSIYTGLGSSLAYSITGNVVETRSHKVDYREVDVEKYRHTTVQRRDISVLFPMGVVFRPGNPRRPLGVNIGFRPGFVIVKERNFDTRLTGVLGFTARLEYKLH